MRPVPEADSTLLTRLLFSAALLMAIGCSSAAPSSSHVATRAEVASGPTLTIAPATIRAKGASFQLSPDGSLVVNGKRIATLSANGQLSICDGLLHSGIDARTGAVDMDSPKAFVIDEDGTLHASGDVRARAVGAGNHKIVMTESGRIEEDGQTPTDYFERTRITVSDPAGRRAAMFALLVILSKGLDDKICDVR